MPRQVRNEEAALCVLQTVHLMVVGLALCAVLCLPKRFSRSIAARFNFRSLLWLRAEYMTTWTAAFMPCLLQQGRGAWVVVACALILRHTPVTTRRRLVVMLNVLLTAYESEYRGPQRCRVLMEEICWLVAQACAARVLRRLLMLLEAKLSPSHSDRCLTCIPTVAMVRALC